MGASAVLAQDTLYLERELPAVSLDMTAVGTVSDTGAGTSAGNREDRRVPPSAGGHHKIFGKQDCFHGQSRYIYLTKKGK